MLRRGLWIALLPACSWMSVTPPPRAARTLRDPECTASVALPVVDTVLAASYATLAVASVVALAQPERNCDSNAAPEFCFDLDLSGLFVTVAIGSAIGAGVHGASAVYGYETTAECRRERAAWRDAEPAPATGEPVLP